MKNVMEKFEGVEHVTEEMQLPEGLDIDYQSIWAQYISEDPGAICGAFLNKFPTEQEIKRTNNQLYTSMGALNYLAPWGTIVDVGSGYNALELSLSRFHNYCPIDVLQYTPQTDIVSGNGLLERIPDNYADIVYCSNMFQHINNDTKRTYLREFYRILKNNSYCYLACSLDHNQDTKRIDGYRWAITGDYFVKIPHVKDFQKMIEEETDFGFISTNVRTDGFTSFWLYKKQKENE